MGQVLQSPHTLTCPQEAVQTRDFSLAFGGNKLLLLQCHGAIETPLAAQARSPLRSYVASPATHIRLLLATFESLVVPLFSMTTSFCFSFSSISPPLTRSSYWPGSLRSSQEWSQECYSLLGQSHLGYGLFSSARAWAAPIW